MTSRRLFRVERLLSWGADAGPVMGLDTSSPTASLAIVANGKVIAETSRAATSHGAALPAAVEELLGMAGMRLQDLKGIAAGLGPGSFTGMRVGLSYMKGLVMALGCAVVGVPTFDCLALSAWEQSAPVPPGTLVCPVVDARKGEVYAGLYRTGRDELEKISEALVITLQNLVLQLSGSVLIAGDSKAREAAGLLGERGILCTMLEEMEPNSRGRYVAAIGAERLSKGEADSPAALEPLYVRTAQATFKPGATGSQPGAKERPWSVETKSSSSNF